MGQRGPAPTFDHDECRRRHTAGAAVRALAEDYGVSVTRIYQVLGGDVALKRMNAASLERQRRLRRPCKGDCGQLVWTNDGRRTGYCPTCLAAKRRDDCPHGLTKYHHGCRCDICRAASASDRRQHRARAAQERAGIT